MEVVHTVNYWAVFLCGIIAMGLGALWYSPMLLGKMWIESLDKSDEELKKDFNPLKAYTVSTIAQLVMAYILARVMSFSGATTPEEGIRVAFMVWVGFIATTMTINMLFEGKTFKQFVVDGGYHFIVLMVYGLILGLWQ